MNEPTTQKPTAKPTSPRHRKGFNFPLPIDGITRYRQTSTLGARLPRAGIEKDIQDWLVAAANKAMKDAGGVGGVMAAILKEPTK